MQRIINKYKNEMTFVTLLLIVLAFIIGGLGKDVLLIVATIIAGVPIAFKAWQAMRMRLFSIELLVTIAVVGALIIGEYVESAVVTFLFMFGDYLEGRTLQKTRSALRELTDMAPEVATVIRDGKEMTVSVDDVAVGEQLVIRAGGKIPVDGTIVKGEAMLDEAAITGEAKRAIKTINDVVFSGTIVDNGYMEMIAEKVGDDTTFAKMIELVEEAQESKTKTEKFLNVFAKYYTPAIVGLAVIVYVITKDVHVAITFLVIACPGALVIGAPVSTVAGIGNGAKHGVLIKGGEMIDELAKVDTIIFDKTGTLTEGKPTVTDIKLFVDEDETKLFTQIALAETISEHHLGKTIVKEAERRGIRLDGKVEHGNVVKGHGLIATVTGEQFVIGNEQLMQRENIPICTTYRNYAIDRQTRGNTAIYVARNSEIVAIISIADNVRSDAKVALASLRASGVRQMIMLTGDNAHTAKAVTTELRLDGYHAKLLPHEKVAFVKQLQEKGHVVAMVGDGINDAPAIATANIGIAMGEGGTDISLEAADVVLMADQLIQFAHAYALTKATVRNMWQNTIFAVSTVALLLVGVLYGKVHLASGMFIHEASVLLVILNGMRLIRFTLPRRKGYGANKERKGSMPVAAQSTKG